MGIWRELNNNTDLFDGNVKEKVFAAKGWRRACRNIKISVEVDHFSRKRK